MAHSSAAYLRTATLFITSARVQWIASFCYATAWERADDSPLVVIPMSLCWCLRAEARLHSIAAQSKRHIRQAACYSAKVPGRPTLIKCAWMWQTRWADTTWARTSLSVWKAVSSDERFRFAPISFLKNNDQKNKTKKRKNHACDDRMALMERAERGI